MSWLISGFWRYLGLAGAILAAIFAAIFKIQQIQRDKDELLAHRRAIKAKGEADAIRDEIANNPESPADRLRRDFPAAQR